MRNALNGSIFFGPSMQYRRCIRRFRDTKKGLYKERQQQRFVKLFISHIIRLSGERGKKVHEQKPIYYSSTGEKKSAMDYKKEHTFIYALKERNNNKKSTMSITKKTVVLFCNSYVITIFPIWTRPESKVYH